MLDQGGMLDSIPNAPRPAPSTAARPTPARTKSRTRRVWRNGGKRHAWPGGSN